MTVPIERALRNYRMAYRQWLNNHGQEGGGGIFLKREASKSVYLSAPEPTPSQYGISITAFEVRAAAAVKEAEFREWQRRNPVKVPEQKKDAA